VETTVLAEESRDFLRVLRKVLYRSNAGGWWRKSSGKPVRKKAGGGQADVSVTSSAGDFPRNTKFF